MWPLSARRGSRSRSRGGAARPMLRFSSSAGPIGEVSKAGAVRGYHEYSGHRGRPRAWSLDQPCYLASGQHKALSPGIFLNLVGDFVSGWKRRMRFPERSLAPLIWVNAPPAWAGYTAVNRLHLRDRNIACPQQICTAKSRPRDRSVRFLGDRCASGKSTLSGPRKSGRYCCCDADRSGRGSQAGCGYAVHRTNSRACRTAHV